MMDFKSTEGIPMMRMTSPYEKQAVKLYTHGVLRKFVEKIQKIPHMVVESIEVEGPNTTYRVYKYDANRLQYKVVFNESEIIAICTCCLYEHDGILCAHVLKVFYYKNIMLILEHYIMRRWTKEENKGMVSDDDGVQIKANNKESQIARYDDLSRVAFKVVSKGSVSERLWEFTKNIIMECNKKVERKRLEYEKEATYSNQVWITMQEVKGEAIYLRTRLEFFVQAQWSTLKLIIS
ncbi:hypothetical protein AMTR_s00047p00139160 [Amborella trichopoda]|uniref:Protein FAR1-RELATED SEQUENCE n=1 Tax=Amborella trichopoda TaxID=13333 RepID=U5D5Q4_AMBTC|nr:hypothetical protein AMTR_s00047p00139160 [Amborella trichopoda]